MSKRNFILLIIVLVITSAVAFFYLSSYKQKGGDQTDSGGTNFLSEFFPFGKSTTTTPPGVENPTDVSGYVPPTTEEVSINKLKRVSDLQVAGFGVFMKERFKDVPIIAPAPATESIEEVPSATKTPKPTPPQTEFMPALRYIEKLTGNIYQTFADKIDERKITTTLIPQVYEAYFGNKGESVVVRYLKDNTIIETFVGSLPKEVLGGDILEDNQITGSFLPENISDLSLSPDTLKIFYLFNVNNSVAGVTSGYLGDKKNQIFSSPFTEWLSFWPNSKMITLTTKPSSNVLGYMYAIDPNQKDFTKILSNVRGLTTLTSPNGKLVLYGDNNLSLKINNTETRETISVGLKTMPEKCVWNNTNTDIYCAVPKFINGENYPDSWYQGEVSFNDEIWKIDAESGNASFIVNPSTLPDGEDIDGIKLSLDENENFLFFMNKSTSLLWELDLR
jgi:hypothetical protein